LVHGRLKVPKPFVAQSTVNSWFVNSFLYDWETLGVTVGNVTVTVQPVSGQAVRSGNISVSGSECKFMLGL